MPVAEVDHQRPQPARVEADAHHVDRRLEQRRIDVDDPVSAYIGGVGGDQVPDAVDGDRRVGLMAAEDHVERLAHRLQLGVVERALGKGGGVACGEQEPILLAKGNLELLEDPEQHLAAGLRAARLDEAQMAGRDPGIERQLELSHPPPLAPLAQEGPDRL